MPQMYCGSKKRSSQKQTLVFISQIVCWYRFYQVLQIKIINLLFYTKYQLFCEFFFFQKWNFYFKTISSSTFIFIQSHKTLFWFRIDIFFDLWLKFTLLFVTWITRKKRSCKKCSKTYKTFFVKYPAHL